MALNFRNGYIGLAVILAVFFAPLAGLHAEPLSETVQVRRDLPFVIHEELPVALDLYLPVLTNADPRPVCVYIHGGGWQAGDKSEGEIFLKGPIDAGWIGVSTNYRLSGTATWPAQIEDIRACLDWIARHAEEINADPQHIVVAGGSAGGQLALMAGLDQTQWGDYRIIGICSLYGPTDLQSEEWHGHQIKYMLTNLLGADPALVPDRARSASPIRFVDAGDPAVLLVHGDADEVVPYEQSVTLLKQLRSRGVPARLIDIPGGGHGNFDETVPDWAFIAREILAWCNSLAGVSDPELAQSP
jgi:acetyl esterase/lipase